MTLLRHSGTRSVTCLWAVTVGAVTARRLGLGAARARWSARRSGSARRTPPGRSRRPPERPHRCPPQRPSVPTDDPYASRHRLPAAGARSTTFDTHRIGEAPQFQTWEYPVPAGWVAYLVTATGDRPIAVGGRGRATRGPVPAGGRTADRRIQHAGQGDRQPPRPPSTRSRDKIVDFDRALRGRRRARADRRHGLLHLPRPRSDRLRYNFFRWFAAPGSTVATLEMSVAGREVDEPGMRALFDAVRRAGAARGRLTGSEPVVSTRLEDVVRGGPVGAAHLHPQQPVGGDLHHPLDGDAAGQPV